MRDGRHLSVVLWAARHAKPVARLIARTAHVPFVQLSAVLSGVKEVKEVMERAVQHRKRNGQSTILFVDEIHRFNKAQQDAFLPHVERGSSCSLAPPRNPAGELGRCRARARWSEGSLAPSARCPAARCRTNAASPGAAAARR
jgi:putative ATPase